ncbi:uncharacterized protein MYCFIDRAFT_173729 [Pseudocercospora fijiensis CIRAD86]|uniref:Uncharacterized protein n=1 Tax=Pseudocercospora fijiensis (strain CIRAD86) TaxID=383855 RepID=M3B650_PSEFD|nr:uncharacterized protein MYCFIDRAFT_173729 [Pseudocercospora fijiensis CIRAD86]EME84808.1 hypothetical protein MYCFIDRAFT_173729 [Pseudocercospora fijiensis CIRAD86]
MLPLGLALVLCYPPLPTYYAPRLPLKEGTSAHWWCCGVLTTAELVLIEAPFNQVPDLVTNRLHEGHGCAWQRGCSHTRPTRIAASNLLTLVTARGMKVKGTAEGKSQEECPMRRMEKDGLLPSRRNERIWRSAKAAGNPGSLRACSNNGPNAIESGPALFDQVKQAHTSLLLTDFHCGRHVGGACGTRQEVWLHWPASQGQSSGISMMMDGAAVELEPRATHCIACLAAHSQPSRASELPSRAEQSASAIIQLQLPRRRERRRTSHKSLRGGGRTRTTPRAIGRAITMRVAARIRVRARTPIRDEQAATSDVRTAERGGCSLGPRSPSRLSNSPNSSGRQADMMRPHVDPLVSELSLAPIPIDRRQPRYCSLRWLPSTRSCSTQLCIASHLTRSTLTWSAHSARLNTTPGMMHCSAVSP